MGLKESMSEMDIGYLVVGCVYSKPSYMLDPYCIRRTPDTPYDCLSIKRSPCFHLNRDDLVR